MGNNTNRWQTMNMNQSYPEWFNEPSKPTDMFTRLSRIMDIDLTSKQLETLNELYASPSDNDELIAATMFRSIVEDQMSRQLLSKFEKTIRKIKIGK